MEEQDADPRQPGIYVQAMNRRMLASLRLSHVLGSYWNRVLPQPVPLVFSLAAGQPVYNIMGLEYASVTAESFRIPDFRIWRIEIPPAHACINRPPRYTKAVTQIAQLLRL